MKQYARPVLRLVLDTNILIAALIRKHTVPYLLFKAWRDGRCELISSQAQIDELERVLAYPKLQKYFTRQEAHEMLTAISIYSTCVLHLPVIHDSPDPDDNLILATAVAGKAHFLVSGDKSDMLALGEVNAIPIVTARRAAQLLELDVE